MTITISFDLRELAQLEALTAALKSVRRPVPSKPKSLNKSRLRELLTTKIGRRLKLWAEKSEPEQRLSLEEIGQLYGLSPRQVAALLAKFGATQNERQIRFLVKHGGEVVTYSMPRGVHHAIRRLGVHDAERRNGAPQVAPRAEDAKPARLG